MSPSSTVDFAEDTEQARMRTSYVSCARKLKKGMTTSRTDTMLKTMKK